MSKPPTFTGSLAAPSAEDLAALKAMSAADRRKLIAAHIEQGLLDIKAGRFIELNSDEDIEAFLY